MSLDILVDVEKLRDFEEKVYRMAREEFGTDDEGKSNKVQVFCLDRSRHWAMHWFPVPYDHKAKTVEEKERILNNLLVNLSMATEAVDTHLKLMRLDRDFEEKKRVKR